MIKLFMIIPLALILCFMIGCQDKEAMAELEALKAQTEVEEQNKDLVNRTWEAWTKGDFETYKEAYASEFVYYQPSNNTQSTSLEESIEFGKIIHNAFSGYTVSIEELIAEEDKVMSRFILRATHEGEFEGIPATGNKIEISGIMISRIENGKIVEEWEEIDILGMMMQLGMELTPKKD